MTKEEFEALTKNLQMDTGQLATLLGVQRSTIYRYLSGAKIPQTVELALMTIISEKNQAQELNAFGKISLIISYSYPFGRHELKNFGQQVKESRRYRKITQRDFSKLTKLSMSYLSDVENGKKDDLSLSTIHKIAKALEVSIEISFEYRANLMNSLRGNRLPK